MRQRITHKLQDRGGVTMLMALFAMLVASMVCIVILGAAVSNVKQTAIDHEHEQSTLALQSAGELMRGEILRTKGLRFEWSTAGPGPVDYGNGTFTVETSLSSVLTSLARQTLGSNTRSGEVTLTLKAAAEGGASSEQYEQTVLVELVLAPVRTNQPEGSGASVVTASETGAQEYDLVATMSVEDEAGNPQYLFLRLKGCKRIVDTKTGVQDTMTAYFEWGTPSFSLKEDGAGDE